MNQETSTIKRSYLWAILVVVAFAVTGAFYWVREAESTQDTDVLQSNLTTPTLAEIDRIQEPGPIETRLLLLGDIMMARSVYGKIRDFGDGDFTYPFQLIQDTLHEADYVFANSEGAISDRGANQGSKYSFRFDPRSADAMAASGIDIVSLANNHIWDWGRVALCDTVDHLGRVGIASVGAGCTEDLANEPYVVTINDTTMTFLAYTNLYPKSLVARGENPGISDFATESILEDIHSLSDRLDIDLIFVSYHWGTEYKTQSNSMQQELAHAMIDAGADVIVGHHPHVAQEIEQYKDGWIFYSLGNFIFDQYFSEETMKGIIGDVRIVEGEIVDVQSIPYKLTETYQPYIFDEESE